MNSTLLLGLWLGLIAVAAGEPKANRLTHLDTQDPFYPGVEFATLTTPQWVGEPGVEAVVVLAIDDLRDPPRYETFLRPILDRLKSVGGQASIFCNECDPAHPLFQQWLKEGVSLEVHTLSHPCPLLAKGNFAGAESTYYGGIALLDRIAGNRAVAFRMPCCDSMNSPSPRFYAEMFNRTNALGQFLEMDSSVMNLETTNDPSLQREWVTDSDGRAKFAKYFPTQTNAITRNNLSSFATTIADYPYPYVIGKLCWEVPPMVFSDWEAQNVHGSNNPETVADWESGLEIAVRKKGVFCLIFHPHGWIKPEQLAGMLDRALQRYGPKVKFLNFPEMLSRLNRNLLAGQSLRAIDGQDNGVRLVDLDGDGHLDVIIGNDQTRLTRLWVPGEQRWAETTFPVPLVENDGAGSRRETGVRFGILPPGGQVVALVRSESRSGAWRFTDGRWIEDKTLLSGLELDGKQVLTMEGGRDRGVRLRDVDLDGACELVVGNESQNAVFAWSGPEKRWQRLGYGLPPGAAMVTAEGRDNGVGWVDLNGDGYADVVLSNEREFSVNLYVPKLVLGFPAGWSREVLAGKRGEFGEIPMLARGGAHPNNGAWFHSGHLWAQNEDTSQLPDVVDRRSFDELMAGRQPKPLSPEEGLASLHPRPGFKVDLVAHEPLIRSPVSFDWGADGKLWVVEMGDYPLGVDGKGKPGGIVRFLEDTNGDGIYDRSTVFLEGLNFPNGIIPWGKGVIISAAPEVFYAEDTDGDGKADVRRTLFSGFVEGNQQHRANGFDYGLDNWLHGANGESGGTVLSVATGKRVNINGHDFRLRPDDGAFEAEAGTTQFGRHRDDWGNWFGNYNSSWGWHYFLPEHYLARNSDLPVRTTKHFFAEYANATRVFQISPRMQRFNDVRMQNYVTAACSAMPYRDELFGPDYAHSIFICEPVYNVVHQEVLDEDGISFTGHRAPGESDREFLASTDNWFRPVFQRTGPDGALYVADMYRLVIEHPEWIPKDSQQRINLRAGEDKGRIYRIYPEGAKLRRAPRLDQMDSRQLVAALDSPNGWKRDTVQRLLVHARDAAAAQPLSDMVATNPSPKVRLQALATLDGLGALPASVLVGALQDPHPAVRGFAVGLTEPFLTAAASGKSLPMSLSQALLARVNDPSLQVCAQLAFTLGEWKDARASAALAELARRFPEDEGMRTAILSSAVPHLGGLLAALLTDAGGRPPPTAIIEQLLGLAARAGDDHALGMGLAAALQGQTALGSTAQFSVIAGLLDALERRNIGLEQFASSASPELRQTLLQSAPVFDRARKTAADSSAPEADRVTAARLVGRGLGNGAADAALLGKLLTPLEPTALREAALAGLKRCREPGVPKVLLAGWRSYSPTTRGEVLEVCFSRAEWIMDLVQALESEQIEARDLGATYQQKLLSLAAPKIHDRVVRLIGSVNSDRQALVDAYRDVSALKRDPTRGAERFQQNCALCHRLGGIGAAVGPDLAGLADKSVPVLLVAILDPNRAVEDRYLSYTAVTRSERELTGVIVSETAGSVTLRAPGGVEEVLLRGDLAQLTSSKLSLMPEGFENSLDHQAMADLVAFVAASGPAPKSFEGNRPGLVAAGPDGTVRLRAGVAEVYGDTLVFEAHYGNLGFWESESDHAAWSLRAAKAGRYDVWLDWAAQGGGKENQLQLDCGEARLSASVPHTASWDEYHQKKIGQIVLSAGEHRLGVHGQPPLRGAMMDLREICLVPEGSAPPAQFGEAR